MMELEKNSVLYNLKVLYVEDEDFTKNEMVKYLKRRVGKLYTAENGVSGIETFKQNNPHIIIADLKMPVMNGLEMIRVIRDMGYNSSIIITSAISDTDTILEAVDIGIVKYVLKPVNPKELINTMEKIGEGILKDKLNNTVLKHKVILDKDKKNNLEKRIKSYIAHFIKVNSGRGPRDIQVFIEANLIKIKAFDTLTNFDLYLISNNKNISLVEYNRRLFYIEGSKEMEKKIEAILNNSVQFSNVVCNCKKNIDELIFSIL